MTPAASQRFLAEWYAPDCAEGGVQHILGLLRAAFASHTGVVTVRLALILAVPADEVLFGVFEASSIEAVAAHCARAGLPPIRINAAVHEPVGAADGESVPG
ncbi:MAG: hypothetical protein SW019_22845 [Actinomycetota bacterium]|nr:hypothetical protein [Actinomycetota bacterium]